MNPKYKILLLILFSYSKITIHSQGYLPVFKDVNRWCTRGVFFSYSSYPFDANYLFSNYNDNTDSTVYIKDTVIKSKTYKALRNPSFGSFYFKNVVSFVREDTLLGKIWYLDSQFNEHVLYDFSLVKGDTMIINFSVLFKGFESEQYSPVSGTYIIDSTISINVYGLTRKVISLKLKNNSTHYYNKLIWIEGIGSNTVPIYINSPSLNETVYDPVNNYFLHNYNASHIQQATELGLIEKTNGTLFLKPNWNCNLKRNIQSGIKYQNSSPNIFLVNNTLHLENDLKEKVRVIIQTSDGRILSDHEYYDNEIYLDEFKFYPQGILILQIINKDQVHFIKHFNL